MLDQHGTTLHSQQITDFLAAVEEQSHEDGEQDLDAGPA